MFKSPKGLLTAAAALPGVALLDGPTVPAGGEVERALAVVGDAVGAADGAVGERARVRLLLALAPARPVRRRDADAPEGGADSPVLPAATWDHGGVENALFIPIPDDT